MATTDTYDTYDAATVPQVIAGYMTAQGGDEPGESVSAFFTSDARVTDEGIDYIGEDGVRAWLAKTGGEYSYTTTLTGQRQDGPAEWTVRARLEGDFPGGVVDLRYRFALRDDRISALVIAP